MSKPVTEYTNDELVKHRDCINEEIKRRKASERQAAREKAQVDNEAFISLVEGFKIERFSWVSHTGRTCNDENLSNSNRGACARCYLLTIIKDMSMDDDIRPVLYFLDSLEDREDLD